jgi:hypothetical protein
MVLSRIALLALISTLPLGAGAIFDATRWESVTLNPGDALHLEIKAENYRAGALAFGLPEYPTGLDFRFLSEVPGHDSLFSATLQSRDGLISLDGTGGFGLTPGILVRGRARQEVWALQGSFRFDEETGGGLFGGGGAVLTLLNLGPAVPVGISGSTLGGDLYVTLSGSRLSVGATAGTVLYEDPPPPGLARMGRALADSEAPEPASGPLLAAVLGGSGAAWLVRRRLLPARWNVGARPRSIVCNRLGQSDTI